MLIRNLLTILLVIFTIHQSSCGFWDDTKKWFEVAADDTKNWVETAADDTKKWVEVAADDTKNWVETAADDTKKWVEIAADDTQKWVSGAVRDVGKFSKNIVKDIEVFGKNSKNSINNFANDLVNDSKKILDSIVDPANNVLNDISATGKKLLKQLQNFSILKDICSAPVPPIISNITSYKDEICAQRVDLVEIKNRIKSSLSELKQKTVDNVLQYSSAFLGNITTKLDFLRPIKFETVSKTKSLFLEQYNSTKKVLNRLVKHLEEPNEENVDKILNNVKKFKNLAITLIEYGRNITRELIETSIDKQKIEIIIHTINDLQILGTPISDIKTNIVDGILSVIIRVVETVENGYEKVKNFLSNVPKQVVKVDAEESGPFKDLKVLALSKADNILKKIFDTADRTIQNVLRVVETEIDYRKNQVCSFINVKIKAIQNVGNFLCNTLFDLDEQFEKLFDNIKGSEQNLIENMNTAEAHIKNYIKYQSNDDQKTLYKNLKKNLINELENVKNHKHLNSDINREFRQSMYGFTKLLNQFEDTIDTECGTKILTRLPNIEKNLQKKAKLCAEEIGELNENEQPNDLINFISDSLNNFRNCAGETKVSASALALKGSDCVNSVTDEIKAFIHVKRDAIIYAKTKFNKCIEKKVNNAKNRINEVVKEAEKCSTVAAVYAVQYEYKINFNF